MTKRADDAASTIRTTVMALFENILEMQANQTYLPILLQQTKLICNVVDDNQEYLIFLTFLLYVLPEITMF